MVSASLSFNELNDKCTQAKLELHFSSVVLSFQSKNRFCSIHDGIRTNNIFARNDKFRIVAESVETAVVKCMSNTLDTVMKSTFLVT